MLKLDTNTTAGTLANLGTKLDGTVIHRTEAGWVLADVAKAPALFQGRLWGLPEIFGKYELAAHRREAIMHLLETYRSGLQTSQLIEHLRSNPWVHAPINKEVVQADLEMLDKEKQIRRGSSRKWVAVE